jgi:hypothetical protein
LPGCQFHESPLKRVSSNGNGKDARIVIRLRHWS